MADHGTDLPVVVLANGVTGLGVLRAFARQGIPVLAYPPSSEMRHSRWYRTLVDNDDAAVSAEPSVERLQRALRRAAVPRAFLCACSDDWARVVSELVACDPGALVASVASSAVLDELQDKARLAALLRRLGVPMPATQLVAGAADIADWPAAADTFHFLKPTDSQRFQLRFGRKAMCVPTAAAARRRLEEIAAAGLTVVLQEYIPGPCTEHHFVDGFVDRDGVFRALFARRRLRIYPADFGNSTAMVSVALSSVAPAVDSVQRVLSAVRYRGIFSAELKRDPRDGAFKLLEINTRPWWFVDFAVRCGVDVCRLAYDDAQGRPLRTVSGYRVGATCVYPYYDFFAVRPLLRAGELSWPRWLVEVAAALQPIGCWDDPLPAIAGVTRIVGGAVRRRLSGRWR